jgi:PIN domain nuclease of toxin-antitoxin system
VSPVEVSYESIDLVRFAGSCAVRERAVNVIDGLDVHVSAASVREISIKAALGSLRSNPADVLRAVEPAEFSLLADQAEHAVLSMIWARITWSHSIAC